MSQLLCPLCKHSSARFEAYTDLSLEIHEYTDSLEEMFEAFTTPERLDVGCLPPPLRVVSPPAPILPKPPSLVVCVVAAAVCQPLAQSPVHGQKHNKIKCEGCSEFVRAHKQLTIYEAPNILCIQLKRFRAGVFGKVNKFVEFPEKLNLKVNPAHESCTWRFSVVR